VTNHGKAQRGTPGGGGSSEIGSAASTTLSLQVVSRRRVPGDASRRFVRCAARCGRQAGRRLRGARIACGSGRRSLAARRARTRRPWLACRRPSAPDGSGRLAGCRRSRWPRCRGDTCRWLSARRSRFCARSSWGCARSLVGWVVRHRRSRGNCAATHRLAVARWCIGRRPRNGMPNGALAGQRWPGSLRTRRYATTCRIAWPG
jgi:hypothetical protein